MSVALGIDIMIGKNSIWYLYDVVLSNFKIGNK